MKKGKLILTVLFVLFIVALFAAMPVSAFSEASDTLGGVVGNGKNPLMSPEFIDGGNGFGSDDSTKESSPSLLVYDEDSEDNPKYCMDMSDMGPYWAEWKYDKAYSINRIIFRTGGDSETYPRRMGDGYTISGSNDGSSWEVVYTGKEMDTDAANDTYYFIDIDASAPYQYFRLFCDTAGVAQDDGGENDRDLVQYSMLILTSADAPAYATPWKVSNYRIGDGSTTIKAVDFDASPFNNDGNPNEAQWNVRTDMAAVQGPQTETGESAYGANIGWIEPGEWVQYSVRFDVDGKFKFAAWQASDSDAPGNIAVYIDDVLVGESGDTEKGGWQAYASYDVSGEAEVTAGPHVIKVEFPKGGLNFAALDITKTGDLAKAADDTPAAGGDEAAAPADDKAGDDTPAAANDDDKKDDTKSGDDEGGTDMILWIVLGAAAVVVIVIIVLIVTKKKK